VSASFGGRAEAYVEVFAPIFDEYQQVLKAAGEIDFEDMIAIATEYIASGRFVSPYRYVLVDEFQDISTGRAKLLKALLNQRPDNQLFAVGDDWQAIFRFAGSDISLIRDFPDNFGVTARTCLEETFRCAERICGTASKFVTCNEAQVPKTMKAVNKTEGDAIFIGRPSVEPGSDILTDTLTHIVEHAGGQEVGVLLIGRYNRCRPGNMPKLQAAFPSLRLRLKTVHASKGLEDDYVVVLDLKAGRMGFPTGMVDDPILNLVLVAPEPFPNAEERRLFYVALTRAKRAVFLIADGSSPSPFVLELERGGYDLSNFGKNPRTMKSCPSCKEGRLVIREGRNSPFVGCSLFPLCEHTEDACPNCLCGIVERKGDQFECTNPECKDPLRTCPRCGRGWMRRRTRRDGRGDFFACSDYPTCRHTEQI
jgi:DNA helicase IV